MMKSKAIATLVVGLMALSWAAAPQESPSDDELLTQFDEFRFFDDEVTTLETRIVSETAEQTREAVVRLLFSGEEASRIEFQSPEELAGQLYIATEDETYFFGPDLEEPLKVSGNTQVFGDSAVAQTAGIRFLSDYTIEERRIVTNDEGEEILEVDLAAVDFSVAFQEATVKADPETYRPISVILYAVSGLPFYEVFYEDYVTRGEDDIYVRVQRIENRVLRDRRTISEILEIGTEEIDPSLFDPANLGA